MRTMASAQRSRLLILMILLHRQRLQLRRLKQWCETRFRSPFHSESPLLVFPTSSSFSPKTKYHCLAFSRPLRGRIRLCLLGLLRVLSSASSSPQVTRRLYILPRVLPILIFDHSLLNILSVNFLSSFA